MTTRVAPEAGTARIARNPRISGGEPTVLATRTSVRSIVLAARQQGSVEGVLDWYPHLTVRDVAEALAFYQRHQAEVNEYIERNRDAG